MVKHRLFVSSNREVQITVSYSQQNTSCWEMEKQNRFIEIPYMDKDVAGWSECQSCSLN